jgi:hypothetical protein
MQQIAKHTTSIRFRRWSRQSYAVFATLGKAISIGSLRIHMATRILFDVLVRLLQGNGSDMQPAEVSREEEMPAEATLLMAALPVFIHTKAEAAASAIINIYSHAQQSGQFFCSGCFFYSYLIKHSNHNTYA